MSNPPQQSITAIGRLPALLRYWRCCYGLIGVLPGLACAALGLALRLPWPLTFALVTALALLGISLGRRFAGLRFEHYRAELHEGEGIVLRSGIWWRSEVWVPTARLQHLDVAQGPLDRRWGMATLSLHTAGSHDQHTRIHGLPLDQAHALREHLMPRQAIQHE